MPLPDGAADLVTMVALYHELEDPGASLAEARRLLAPGGRLLIVDWKRTETPHGPPPAARVPAEDIASALAAAGFADVTVHDALDYFSVVTGTR